MNEKKIKYFKFRADISMIECNKIISAMDTVSKKPNTISINMPINSDSKNVRDCYILHTVSLAMILLLVIIIVCSHYAKHKLKKKFNNGLTI